ncbi:MAG: HAMP domain-containing sensor histidine kinase [Hydrogenophaga sp.]|nr:HAMP domain-containing sensor histidine kinase [Hydrogenophaga sp.]
MKQAPWHRRARLALSRSLRVRLVLMFLLFALALAGIFIGGVQKALSVGWRDAARPLLMDYVDRLAAEITADTGSPPAVARAQAITERLPITVRISGPQVVWASHPDQPRPDWMADREWAANGSGEGEGRRLLQRSTADGHQIEFGLSARAWERRPRFAWFTLGALLLLTGLAYGYVRRQLRPLDAIRDGALRLGAGDFAQPIPVRHAHRPDELGQLATTINTMGRDIEQMLDAKRALLLAISHELRSPLTRARLHTELLPEDGDVRPQREALLRDLGEMSRLIADLLESERLSGRHAAVQREPTDLVALAREVITELAPRHVNAAAVRIEAAHDLPVLALDATRMRLLLRNLLDNACRHSLDAAQPPELHVRRVADGVVLEVRDFGPGVSEAQLGQLAQPFYRPDSARTRSAGGVGLGLYLCKLVAQAHGGRFEVHNAAPGLRVTVTLPGG